MNPQIGNENQKGDISSVSSEICRICQSSKTSNILLYEMMFGTRKEFHYFECNSCGCIQIEEYPRNISSFYPPDYYSFQISEIYNRKLGDISKIYIKSLFMRIPAFRLWWLKLDSTKQWLSSKPLVKLVSSYNKDVTNKILDVGCGNGLFIQEMIDFGYVNSYGIDPYINKDAIYNGRVSIARKNIFQTTEKFDCITFHHSLEHMEKQHDVLHHVNEILKLDGVVIIRIPLSGGLAWRRYGHHWVQLDAPRHFYIHTENSIKILAAQCKFRVTDIIYDSYGLQFWGSELYKNNIALMDKLSPAQNSNAIFSKLELHSMEIDSQVLNDNCDGDQAIVIMRKL